MFSLLIGDFVVFLNFDLDSGFDFVTEIDLQVGVIDLDSLDIDLPVNFFVFTVRYRGDEVFLL